MIGITSYGAYVPYWRLKREVMLSGGKGEKSVGNFDEDSLTMAVSAVINSVKGLDRSGVDGLFFASTTFPYKEKQGSSLVSAAADFRKDILTADFANALKGGTTAVNMAADIVKAGSAKSVVVVGSDCRLGAPGSPFERAFGDGAGALVIGDSDVAVEIEARASLYDEMIDVWRADNDRFVRAGEDRFIQPYGYEQAVLKAAGGLMKSQGMAPKDFAKAVIYAPDQRRLMGVAAKLGFDPKTQVQDPLISVMGNTGTAYPLMLLIAALEDSKPGDKILWASYGDGCDAFILKVTDKIEGLRGNRGMKSLLESKMDLGKYEVYLQFKGLLKAERGPQRAPEEISLTALWRNWDDVIRFYGSKCKSCGTVQYPSQRVCTKCHAKDQFDKVRLSDKKASLFTFSLDFVSNPLDVPMVVSVIDFEGGGRTAMSIMTDRDAKQVRIGMPLEMTFRKLYYCDNEGITNYYWKCVPPRA